MAITVVLSVFFTVRFTVLLTAAFTMDLSVVFTGRLTGRLTMAFTMDLSVVFTVRFTGRLTTAFTVASTNYRQPPTSAQAHAHRSREFMSPAHRDVAPLSGVCAYSLPTSRAALGAASPLLGSHTCMHSCTFVCAGRRRRNCPGNTPARTRACSSSTMPSGRPCLDCRDECIASAVPIRSSVMLQCASGTCEPTHGRRHPRILPPSLPAIGEQHAWTRMRMAAAFACECGSNAHAPSCAHGHTALVAAGCMALRDSAPGHLDFARDAPWRSWP
eukprot:364778-Chlamydomonas_euryale.AAC.2